MPGHQLSFREGWQSQNLAKVILYNFSFLGEPLYIADDIGADYYCTLFTEIKKDKNTSLIPSYSYVIQIKSENDSDVIDITKYLPLLSNMEIPFFIGVVNRDKDKLSLSIYSGELLPCLFAFKGYKENPPNKLQVKLFEITSNGEGDFHWLNNNKWWPDNEDEYLLFPKVTELSLLQEEKDFKEGVSKIKERCEILSKNLVSFRKDEYSFIDTTIKGHKLFFSHLSMIPIIQCNLEGRFAELFNNITFLLSSVEDEVKMKGKELYEFYEPIYLQLLENKCFPSHIIDQYLVSWHNLASENYRKNN